MGCKPGPSHREDPKDGRAEAARDDKEVVLLAAAGVVSRSVYDTAHQLEEASGSKFAGGGVKVSSDEPRPSDRQQAGRKLFKDAKVGNG